MNTRFLRDEAARFRGMAEEADREATRLRLLAMAADYEARAGAAPAPTAVEPRAEESEPIAEAPPGEEPARPRAGRKMTLGMKETIGTRRGPARPLR